MTKKGIIGIISIIIVGFGLIITIPITILSIGLSPYGIIDQTIPFEYIPDSSSPIEKLNIDVEYGEIELQYVSLPVDYFAKIELKVEMIGFNLAGKNISDYFNITWQSNSSIPSFVLQFNSDINKKEIVSLIKNVTVFVKIRADKIFDIMITSLEGNVHINIPFMVSIHNLVVNTHKGDIIFDLNHCILDGNISSHTDQGNFKLSVNNIQCLENVIWNFNTLDGGMDIEIYQYKEMGANITGIGLFTGLLNLTYKDNLVDVGALFTFPSINWLEVGQIKIGFDIEPLSPIGFNLKSTEFPAENNFSFLLNVTLGYKINVTNNSS